MLSLDAALPFDPARAEEFLESLPAAPAVLRIEPRPDLPNARPLLLRTANLRRRLRLLLGPADSNSRRVNLRDYAAEIRYRITGSEFEQLLVHWQHARELWPANYRRRLRLHPPALVKLSVTAAYPRAFVTRRIAGTGLYAGPFAGRRAAEAFLNSSLDLFKLRRCQIKIRRDPAFPGCIYSEMKMCLAPCFAGCTDEEYAAEAARVASFLASGGAAYAEELSREREQASADLDFERAAALHKRLEKVDSLRRGLPELIRRLEDLQAMILQRAARENAIAVFLIRGGRIADPFVVDFANASEPRSVEQILRDKIEHPAEDNSAEPSSSAPPAASFHKNVELEDHLALLARWFYANPRAGEIFFEQPEPTGWQYRRILRACSRLLQAASPPPASRE